MPSIARAVSLDATIKAHWTNLMRPPSAPQGMVQRSRMVLAAADGKRNQQIAGELHRQNNIKQRTRANRGSGGAAILMDNQLYEVLDMYVEDMRRMAGGKPRSVPGR